MSVTDTETIEIERPDRAVLVRRFDTQLAAGDGRTVDMRIVPFGEKATVADGHGGVPKGVPYQEEWMPGVFDKQLNAANRVLLNFEHQQGLPGVIGRGLELRRGSDGYHGSFRVMETADGDKALMLIREDVLTGASLEAIPQKSIRTTAGVVQRVKAHLDSVALCRLGAFPSAVVTAVRENDLMVDEDMLPVELDREVVERCRRLGINLPDRYRSGFDDDQTEMLVRAFTDAAWDGSASRWDTAAAYCSAAAIDLNPAGKPKTKALCHLPFKEPGSGDVNVNGVRAALSRLGQGFPQDASPAQRDRARAMLERLLATFNSQQGQ
jgi:HK97 family phage prohead protease